MQSSPERKYTCSAETQQSIIDAAIELFGRFGFERTTTRDIAREAGVKPPALNYHFGNKEALYRACAEFIALRFAEALAPALQTTHALLANNPDPQCAIEAICDLQNELADFLFGPTPYVNWQLFVAREQAGEGLPGAYEIIHTRFVADYMNVASQLMAQITRLPADHQENQLRVMTLFGQTMMPNTSRSTVLTTLAWNEIDGERLVLLKRVIKEQTRAILTALIKSASG